MKNDDFELVRLLLISICGNDYVFTSPDDKLSYQHDQTEGMNFPFEFLVKPANAKEIADIIMLCSENRIPIIPRGGGSGVTGGALPIAGGLVLSLERLNRILEINKTDLYVVAEAGVVTDDLCRAVETVDLYFPIIPSSSAYCFIGGNVAENAGSLNSCKYGKTGQYVISLEVVLMTGEIIWTGANVLKNSTGLNITQLFVGSEGILGIITKVVYRLLPKPAKEIFVLAAFDSFEMAYNAAMHIKKSRIRPSIVEVICKNAIRITADYLKEALPLVNGHITTQLLIGMDDESGHGIDEDLVILQSLIEQFTNEDILLGESTAEKQRLSKLRYNIGNAMTANGNRYRDLDICVPFSFLPTFLKKIEEIEFSSGVEFVCFGHILDGNIHTMVFERANQQNSGNRHELENAIYSFAVANGGVISGEHGIGILQKEFMQLQFSTGHIELMKGIKAVFDPLDILNPGKVL
jgi:glycolate oxidase